MSQRPRAVMNPEDQHRRECAAKYWKPDAAPSGLIARQLRRRTEEEAKASDSSRDLSIRVLQATEEIGHVPEPLLITKRKILYARRNLDGYYEYTLSENMDDCDTTEEEMQ